MVPWKGVRVSEFFLVEYGTMLRCQRLGRKRKQHDRVSKLSNDSNDFLYHLGIKANKLFSCLKTGKKESNKRQHSHSSSDDDSQPLAALARPSKSAAVAATDTKSTAEAKEHDEYLKQRSIQLKTKSTDGNEAGLLQIQAQNKELQTRLASEKRKREVLENEQKRQRMEAKALETVRRESLLKAQRWEREKLEVMQRDRERLEEEKKDREKKEAERKLKEQKEAEQREREQKEQDRKEREQQDAIKEKQNEVERERSAIEEKLALVNMVEYNRTEWAHTLADVNWLASENGLSSAESQTTQKDEDVSKVNA